MNAPALVYEPPRDVLSALVRKRAQADIARPAYVKLKRAVLSVCFDDFPRSAAEKGAAALERVNARGTFYACAGLMGETGPSGEMFDASDLRRVYEAGHEIACHTYSHADCARTPPQDVIAECGRNAIEIALLGVKTPLRSLAYPFGETTARLKRALPNDFTTARGVAPGLNRGEVDLAQLKAYPFYGWEACEPILAALDKAKQTGAWMIVFTHDVAAEPSRWGAPVGALGAMLRKARELNMDILPVGEAADRILAAQD